MSPEATSIQKPRVLSGMRPTGKLHLGNYVGALENWVKLQESGQYDCFFFIADWHALTTDYANASQLKQNCVEVLLDWLAAGLDPERSTIFIQSHVPQHAELHLIFSMITPLGWLERVPTYKEQRENIRDKDLGTYGFLGYPLLQSADILLYSRPCARAESLEQKLFVPVGEDQVAHIELTREIARRFNAFYHPKGRSARVGHVNSLPVGITNPVFPEPQPLLTQAPKLRGTDGRKMSKSYNNVILLSDPEETIREKLRLMVTDRPKQTDKGNPDNCPVGDHHKTFSSEDIYSRIDHGCKTASISCVECKNLVIDSILTKLGPMQLKRQEYLCNTDELNRIIQKGDRKALEAAGQTIETVRKAVG